MCGAPAFFNAASIGNIEASIFITYAFTEIRIFLAVS